jgi:Leucine-rich repeat (LRR) protein
MAQKTIAELKVLWITGYTPTQADFANLFDSYPNYLSFFIHTTKGLYFPNLLLADTSIDISHRHVSTFPNFEDFPNLEEIDITTHECLLINLSDSLVNLERLYFPDGFALGFDLPASCDKIEEIDGSANFLVSMVLDSSFVELTSLIFSDNLIVSLPLELAFVNLVNIRLENNKFSIAGVDAVLLALDTIGTANGVLWIDGTGNAIPTGGALNANYLSLVGNGWVVNINT